MGSQLARFSDHGAAPFAAQDRWQETFWNEPAQRGATGSRASWMEQAELWAPAPSDIPARPAPEPAALPAPALTVARVSPRASRTQAAAKPRSLRTTPRGGGYAQRRQSVRTEDIARYLQVNQAVHGVQAGPGAFDLPRRSFSAEVPLWKGSEMGTPFLSGC